MGYFIPNVLVAMAAVITFDSFSKVGKGLFSKRNAIRPLLNAYGILVFKIPRQLLKELFLPMFSEMDSVLDILLFALPGIQVQEGLMDNPLYHNAFCVEEVNRLVGEGVPFRDAYRQIGKAVQEGSFHFSGKLQHSHEGSIGNLCNDRIAERFHRILSTLQKS